MDSELQGAQDCTFARRPLVRRAEINRQPAMENERTNEIFLVSKASPRKKRTALEPLTVVKLPSGIHSISLRMMHSSDGKHSIKYLEELNWN